MTFFMVGDPIWKKSWLWMRRGVPQPWPETFSSGFLCFSLWNKKPYQKTCCPGYFWVAQKPSFPMPVWETCWIYLQWPQWLSRQTWTDMTTFPSGSTGSLAWRMVATVWSKKGLWHVCQFKWKKCNMLIDVMWCNHERNQFKWKWQLSWYDGMQKSGCNMFFFGQWAWFLKPWDPIPVADRCSICDFRVPKANEKWLFRNSSIHVPSHSYPYIYISICHHCIYTLCTYLYMCVYI